MSLTARILLGFALLSLAGYFLVLNPVLDRVERQYLEAAEEPMVDTAQILAAIVSRDVTNGAIVADPKLAAAMEAARGRAFEARIYRLLKTGLSMDFYITDAAGTVVYDSAHPDRVGRDFSGYLDVRNTLRGRYGARTTRLDPKDPTSSVLHVAAPILDGERIAGVLSVYKPQRSMLEFIEETRRSLRWIALASTGVFLLAGLALSRWVAEPLGRLTRHAESIARGERPPPPSLPGRHLRILGRTLEDMRDALENRRYVEHYVQSLTHEMKGPLAAIRGAAELLAESPPPAQAARFTANIASECLRLERFADQLLSLSALETRKSLEAPAEVDLAALARRVADHARSRLAGTGRRVEVETSGDCRVRGEEVLLELALGNLIANALDFSPDDGRVLVCVRPDGRGRVVATVEDEGPGIDAWAIDRVFERFYSLPRPSTGRKSSGLGLCFVREAAALHRGTATLENHPDHAGARATLTLPAATGPERILRLPGEESAE